MRRRGGKKLDHVEGRTDRVDSDKKRRFERQLVKFEALPEYLKDNDFILDHYRCEWPLKETMFSVFSWHNETLNIWTHLGGFVIFVTLTVLSSMEKTNIESMIARFFRPALRTTLMMAAKTNINGSDSFFPVVGP